MITIALILLILTSLFFTYYKRKTSYWKNKNVNGPKPIPIFGNCKESVLRRKTFAEVYKEIYNMYEQEKIVGIYRLMQPMLLIRDLDIAKQILIKDFDCFSERGIAFKNERVTANLFHCNTEIWKFLRPKLSILFTSGQLKKIFDVVSNCGDDFLDNLQNKCLNDSEQDCHRLIRKYAMIATMAGIFDLDISSIDDSFLNELDYHICNLPYFSEISFLPICLRKILPYDFVQRFFLYVMDVALKNSNGKPKTNLLDILFKLEEISNCRQEKTSIKITNEFIISQQFLFFAAGYENTNIILSFALFNLALNCNVQNELISEVDNIFKNNNGKLNYEDVMQMKYMDKVFNETLRMNPATNIIQRVPLRNYRVPDTNIVLEKGVPVIISPLAIQRDARYFANPDKFDPERFSAENCRDRHSCAFLPFGAGPRSCVGQRFSKMLFHIAMIKILSKYTVTPSRRTNRVEFDPFRILLAMKDGLYLNFIPRKCNEYEAK